MAQDPKTPSEVFSTLAEQAGCRDVKAVTCTAALNNLDSGHRKLTAGMFSDLAANLTHSTQETHTDGHRAAHF